VVDTKGMNKWSWSWKMNVNQLIGMLKDTPAKGYTFRIGEKFPMRKCKIQWLSDLTEAANMAYDCGATHFLVIGVEGKITETIELT
jgi:hypothetical protein